MEKQTVLAVVGATASGKSALAMELASRLNGEIVCMDSMQIYRRMDVGTAKPTADERRAVPHHMLDVVEPTQSYTVATYADEAKPILMDILQRGKLPILTGGTGLYLRALTHGMTLGGAGCNEALRDRYRDIALESGGKERLHDMLARLDPATAARLHPNDLRRVIRALEICELTGAPMSEQAREEPEQPFRVLPIGLAWQREALYERIERRVDAMLQNGLLGEVEALLASGVPAQAQSMQGIGYKELTPVLKGEEPLEDAVWLVKRNTRRYAKRQGTFFRAEPTIEWLDATDVALVENALKAIENDRRERAK